MAELSFYVEDVPEMPRTSLVKVSGAIDAKTVLTFQEQLEELQKGGNNRFILDMDGIKYVNSTGLGTLVNVADNLENAGGGIALVKIHPKVKVVFDMLGLNAFFKIFETKEDALSFFGVGAAPPPPPEPPKKAAAAPPAPPPSSARKPTPVPAAVAAPAPSGSTAHARQNPDGTFLVTLDNVNLTVPRPGTYKCPRSGRLFKLLAGGAVEFVNQGLKLQPLQMRLSCAPSCIEGLGAFIAVLARHSGCSDGTISSIQVAVRDTCQTIVAQAYDSPDNQSFNVVIIPSSQELRIQVYDSGKFLNGHAGVFNQARSHMDQFEHSQHPKGGNLVNMAKRCG